GVPSENLSLVPVTTGPTLESIQGDVETLNASPFGSLVFLVARGGYGVDTQRAMNYAQLAQTAPPFIAGARGAAAFRGRLDPYRGPGRIPETLRGPFVWRTVREGVQRLVGRSGRLPLLPSRTTRRLPTMDWTLDPPLRQGSVHQRADGQDRESVRANESGVQHLWVHAPWSTEPRTSRFNQSTWNRLRAFIYDTVEHGREGRLTEDDNGHPQAGCVYEHRFGSPVGTNDRGRPLYGIRVVVDTNNHL